MPSIQQLKKVNVYASVAHFALAIILIILYAINKPSQTASKIGVYQYFLASESSGTCTSSGQDPVLPDQCNVNIDYQPPKKIFTFNVIFGAIAFFLITGIAHAYYAADANGFYSAQIRNGGNSYRWFEYAASASLMSVMLGLTEGVRDFSTLSLLFIITAAMQMNGYATESLLHGKEPIGTKLKESIRASQISAWTLFVGLWAVLLYNFGTIVHDVKTNFPSSNARVPTWIWVIVILQLVQYALFGVVQGRHIRMRTSGKAFDYSVIERMYIGLSFSAKLSLAAGLGYGLIFRTRNC